MGVQVPLSAPHFKWVSCFGLDPIYLANRGLDLMLLQAASVGQSSSNANKGLQLAGAQLETQKAHTD